MNKLKSTDEDLKDRGSISDIEFEEIQSSISMNIDDCLDSPFAFMRTYAIRKIKNDKDYTYLDKLCKLLQTEKKLYTKIEISDCLSDFGEQSIEPLIDLLGKIGKNQHTYIGNFDLEKKSFPLPRDIAARILIRMGASVFPYLEKIFCLGDIRQISEAIDVIGHVSFTSGDISMEKFLLEYYRQSSSPLIKWKLVRAFQSFNSQEIIDELERIIRIDDKNLIMSNEAATSLLRIRARQKNDQV